MSETVEIVITRPFGGHRRGDVVEVSVDDERYASHVRAGNAVALKPDLVDAVLDSGDVYSAGDDMYNWEDDGGHEDEDALD